MSRVPLSAVLTYERLGRADAAHVTAMRSALEAAGIEFEIRASPTARLR